MSSGCHNKPIPAAKTELKVLLLRDRSFRNLGVCFRYLCISPGNHCLVPAMTQVSLAVIVLLVRAGRNGAETYSKSIMSDCVLPSWTSRRRESRIVQVRQSKALTTVHRIPHSREQLLGIIVHWPSWIIRIGRPLEGQSPLPLKVRRHPAEQIQEYSYLDAFTLGMLYRLMHLLECSSTTLLDYDGLVANLWTI